jgi:hypothetical protein
MLFLTTYRVRPEVRRDPAGMSKVLAEYGDRGDAPGTIAHYVAADGSAGYTVREVASLADVYDAVIEWEPFLEISSVPIIPIGDAIGTLATRYAP